MEGGAVMGGSLLWQVLGWIALGLNVWGNLALTRKGATGWLVRLACNLCWIAYSFDQRAWALLANHAVFVPINVYGWAKWFGEATKEAPIKCYCDHPYCKRCYP